MAVLNTTKKKPSIIMKPLDQLQRWSPFGLVVAATRSWILHKMDVHNVFLMRKFICNHPPTFLVEILRKYANSISLFMDYDKHQEIGLQSLIKLGLVVCILNVSLAFI
ncbi:hypothetical protein CR513_13830, partial [Mucuna pruriens]